LFLFEGWSGFHPAGRFSAAWERLPRGHLGNPSDQVLSGSDPDIRGDQEFFKFFQQIGIDALRPANNYSMLPVKARRVLARPDFKRLKNPDSPGLFESSGPATRAFGVPGFQKRDRFRRFYPLNEAF
jgi:hypothetical protein